MGSFQTPKLQDQTLHRAITSNYKVITTNISPKRTTKILPTTKSSNLHLTNVSAPTTHLPPTTRNLSPQTRTLSPTTNLSPATTSQSSADVTESRRSFKFRRHDKSPGQNKN
jgi:hypothetical protein